jgi:hypothetical protein
MTYHDDDEQPLIQSRGIRSWQVFVILLIAIGFTLTITFRHEILPPTGQDRFIRQLRAEILAGSDLRSVYREYDTRKDRQDIVARLADDPHPRVRVTAIELLMRHEVTVKAPIIVGRYRLLRPDSTDQGPDSPVLRKLLTDPEPEVRQAAIRSVTSLARTQMFESELLHILWNGPEDERLLVSSWLGHWHGREALRVFASPLQSPAVRSSVFRGIQTWRSREFATGLDTAVGAMLTDPDPEIRLLALEASRWIESPRAVELWFLASQSPDRAIACRAVEYWIAGLVEDDDRYGMSGNRLPATSGLFRQLRDHSPEQLIRFALISHVLCQAAMGHAAKLESHLNDPTAWHVKHIVHPLIVIPRELRAWWGASPSARSDVFTAWLPGEPHLSENPPRRHLTSYILEQLKKPAQWCEAHRGLNGLHELEPINLPPGSQDTLGRYLDLHQVGSYAAIEQTIAQLTSKD